MGGNEDWDITNPETFIISSIVVSLTIPPVACVIRQYIRAKTQRSVAFYTATFAMLCFWLAIFTLFLSNFIFYVVKGDITHGDSEIKWDENHAHIFRITIDTFHSIGRIGLYGHFSSRLHTIFKGTSLAYPQWLLITIVVISCVVALVFEVASIANNIGQSDGAFDTLLFTFYMFDCCLLFLIGFLFNRSLYRLILNRTLTGRERENRTRESRVQSRVQPRVQPRVQSCGQSCATSNVSTKTSGTTSNGSAVSSSPSIDSSTPPLRPTLSKPSLSIMKRTESTTPEPPSTVVVLSLDKADIGIIDSMVKYTLLISAVVLISIVLAIHHGMDMMGVLHLNRITRLFFSSTILLLLDIACDIYCLWLCLSCSQKTYIFCCTSCHNGCRRLCDIAVTHLLASDVKREESSSGSGKGSKSGSKNAQKSSTNDHDPSTMTSAHPPIRELTYSQRLGALSKGKSVNALSLTLAGNGSDTDDGVQSQKCDITVFVDGTVNGNES